MLTHSSFSATLRVAEKDECNERNKLMGERSPFFYNTRATIEHVENHRSTVLLSARIENNRAKAMKESSIIFSEMMCLVFRLKELMDAKKRQGLFEKSGATVNKAVNRDRMGGV